MLPIATGNYKATENTQSRTIDLGDTKETGWLWGGDHYCGGNICWLLRLRSAGGGGGRGKSLIKYFSVLSRIVLQFQTVEDS